VLELKKKTTKLFSQHLNIKKKKKKKAGGKGALKGLFGNFLCFLNFNKGGAALGGWGKNLSIVLGKGGRGHTLQGIIPIPR